MNVPPPLRACAGKAVAFLLLGTLSNAAVACLCAAMGAERFFPPYSVRLADPSHVPTATVPAAFWSIRVRAGIGCRVATVSYSTLVVSDASADSAPDPSLLMDEWSDVPWWAQAEVRRSSTLARRHPFMIAATGFPWSAFVGSASASHRAWVVPVAQDRLRSLFPRFMPYYPIWYTIIANTICHAALLWLALVAYTTIIARIRLRRSRCPHCNYSTERLRGAVCPECGSPLEVPRRPFGGSVGIPRSTDSSEV